VICPACGRDAPQAFPGATVSCACGHAIEVAPIGPSFSALPGAQPRGPYREPAERAPAEPPSSLCPFCGHECPALVRICPGCDVRLENVRCPLCYSLQSPGAFSCGRCGRELELEPLLDPMDAPCPRCTTPLEAMPGPDTPVHECPRCGGLFVLRDALAEILCRAETTGPFSGRAEPRRLRLDEVRYLPCPLCRATMNRVNFGQMSGVIIDVCRDHGTWFDAGELTRVIAFAASGGLEKSRAREAEQRRVREKDSMAVRADLAAIEARNRVTTRLDMWREVLSVFFR
jgi:Zn-finger nucleic acid-binding protein